MILYKTLSEASTETLHGAFLEAFSDYQVKLDLPFRKFEQMLLRRGYCPDISMGAFDNDRLVGFVLNGFRNWIGKPTVYDLGTGVIPQYRRRGIISDLLSHIKKLLKENQVEQYLLEVIKSNQSAFELYKKQGFEIQREFSCFQLEKDKFIPGETGMVERVESLEMQQLKEFWDFEPSWQNSVASVSAVPEAFNFFVVRVNNNLAGYGIIDKESGDIPQIAVNRDYRGNGIAHGIMTELVKSTNSRKVALLNVETPSGSIENFLNKLGFVLSVGQYEMLLKL